VVSGTLHDDENAWTEIGEWCRAATAVGTLRGSRFGFLGHTYPGMLDMYSDFTMHQAQLGLHLEVLEMDDLQDRVEDIPDHAVTARLEETREAFEIDESVDEEDLEWSARVSAGLDRLAEDFDLDALAYYYRGTNGSVYERLGAGLILGNSLLTARGIPASGEGDLKNAVAMKVMDSLGAGDLSRSSTPWTSTMASSSWDTTVRGTLPSATISLCSGASVSTTAKQATASPSSSVSRQDPSPSSA
jgi:L-arabinose isomerase